MFERLMFRAVPFWLLALTALVALGGALLFGAIVYRTATGGREFGGLGNAAVEIAKIPTSLGALFSSDTKKNAPGPAPLLPDGLWQNPQAGLIDPDYLLVSRFRPELGLYVAELIRLADGKMLRQYVPDADKINARSKLVSPLVDVKRHRRPGRYYAEHPYLTDDGGLVFKSWSPLVSVDACGGIKWTLDGYFHHSLEPDGAGAYWVSGSLPKTRQKRFSPQFREDALTRVSGSGQLLEQYSVYEILKENGLEVLIEGRPYMDDPTHINDIQPALSDGTYWQKGDLFLSFRNISALMLFRPSTRKILWWKQGPWLKQHDVQILDDHRIALFDNYVLQAANEGAATADNRILTFDFATGKVEAPFEAAMKQAKYRTPTQGRQLILANGDAVIEETDYGRIERISPDGTVRWRYISARADGTRLKLGWSRYIDGKDRAVAIANAAKAKCP